jgi:hypothetical protein
MRRTRASARWIRFALAFALALGMAVASAAQQHILTNGRNLQIPINHGLPDKPLGFTFCRLLPLSPSASAVLAHEGDDIFW